MDHRFDPKTDLSTGCKWNHGFDPTVQGVNGTMDLITSTGCKADHGFDPTTDTSTGLNGTMD